MACGNELSVTAAPPDCGQKRMKRGRLGKYAGARSPTVAAVLLSFGGFWTVRVVDRMCRKCLFACPYDVTMWNASVQMA